MYPTPALAPQQASLFPHPRRHTHRSTLPRAHLPRHAGARGRATTLEQPQIRSSRDAAVIFRADPGNVDREHFLVAMLDQKNKVIGINTVSMGSLTASVVHPREVHEPAILSNAAALGCAATTTRPVRQEAHT